MTTIKNTLFFLVLCGNLIKGMEIAETDTTLSQQSQQQQLAEQLKMFRDPLFNKTVGTLMRENSHYPIVFGGKTFHLDQIAALNEEQRNIFYQAAFPSGLDKCFGSLDTMLTEDIEEFNKRMPSSFTRGIQVNARTKKCCKGELPCSTAAAGLIPSIAGVIGFASNPSNPFAPWLIGISCGTTVVMETTILLSTLLSQYCCYSEKEYTFGEDIESDN